MNLLNKILICFFLLIYQLCIAQNSPDSTMEKKSRIVLIRPSMIAGDLTGYKVFDKGNNLLTKLRVNRPYTKIVPSGELILISRILRKTTFKTILEPNKTYIIKFTIDGSPFLDKPQFRVVKIENFYQKPIEIDSLLLK